MWGFCFPKSKSRREAGKCSVYIYVSCPPISKIKVNQWSQLRAATHHTHTVTQMFSNISGGLKVLSSFSMTDFSVCVRGWGKEWVTVTLLVARVPLVYDLCNLPLSPVLPFSCCVFPLKPKPVRSPGICQVMKAHCSHVVMSPYRLCQRSESRFANMIYSEQSGSS